MVDCAPVHRLPRWRHLRPGLRGRRRRALRRRRVSRWTAVVLNWNGGQDTERCLDSLTGFDAVVVADNGSTDGSLEALRARDGISLIENGANLGFSGGN